MKRFAVIPSDPLEEYEKKGTGHLQEEYFNPNNFFDEVYILSPLEHRECEMFGMKVIPTKDRQLKKRLKELSIDIVRAYDGHKACDMACGFKQNNVPVVVSVHDIRPENLYKSIKYADIVFSVSAEVTQLVSNYFINSERIWYLPNRINFNTMQPISNSSYSDLSKAYPFKFIVLQIGRKSPEKNIESIIRALSILGEDYCLISIGSGDAEPYRNFAAENKVNNRCFFIDSIKNTELPKYYSFASCLCNPSISEAMSVALIEALACRCIVVTSEIAAKSVNINNLQNGFTIKDPRNIQKLSDIIKSACTDQNAIETIRNNSRKSVECFEKTLIDNLEVDYYKNILDKKQKGDFKKPFLKFWR